MKFTELFTKTRKNPPKDEASANAKLLVRGGFVDKLMAGVYTFLPLGLRVMLKIENIIREEMNAVGGQEVLMPGLLPKENWKKTSRWESVTDLYKLQDASGREFALGPTHEEIVVPLMKNFVSSYKDLPLYVYQIQRKFRMELRAKSGLLRGREFLMKDFYSFHLDERDLDKYYEKMKKAYFRIFTRAGIGKQIYLTYASGGTFSKYSHEFQATTPAGEDIIYICEKCRMAVNREIKGAMPKCPSCCKHSFREEKAIEVGNIFKLKTKFTLPFDLKITGRDGRSREVLMGTYGIGLDRLMGTIVEIHHDDKGIIWPEAVAPFQVHLLVLNQESGIRNQAEKLYKDLLRHDIEVLYDDRENASAGQKFADADLIGAPQRITIGKQEKDKSLVELKDRKSGRVKKVGVKEVLIIQKPKPKGGGHG